MSARLLKKVLEEQEAAQQQPNSSCVSDDSDSPETSAPAINPFDLLSDHDDNEDDTAMVNQGKDSENFHESEAQIHYGTHPSLVGLADKQVLQAIQKAKKKKKKKSKPDTHSASKDSETSYENMLENLSIGAESSEYHPFGDSCSKAKSAKLNSSNTALQLGGSSILRVDPKYLRAENELRRIFGSKVVSSFEKVRQTGTSRQSRGGRRGTHNHKRTILISPSEHWPRWDGSLSMELLDTIAGIHYFRYLHSSSYGQAQSAFEAAKAVHDLNGIANILVHHPYHIESLVTLAEFFQFSGEHHQSADAVARCLYGLECAWHPMFTPMQSNCQLKYDHEINKPFFAALFAHMKNLDRRGCHRSALEVCKLLLSLDSDDPMGALFCIDYFALRAEEYSWLELFSDKYGSDNCLWLFPNFSFSLAVCRFYLEGKECENVDKETGRASSAELMKQALMLHPAVLKKLVAKVPLKEQVWTSILKHRFFESDQTGSPSLDHLISLYVERSYLIWRLPDLQKLLKDSAQSIILNLQDNGSDANDWACVRKEAFPHDKNEYRHLMLTNFSDTAPTMPADNLQQFMVDPRVRDVENGDRRMNHPMGVGAPRDLANRNAFAVLFESMLPWIDYGRIDGEDNENDPNE